MTRVPRNLDGPWWEQFPGRLAEEERRFRERFRPPVELYHDPRTPQTRPEAYCAGHFVWRGQITARVGRAGQGQKAVSFTVDFIYPRLYPFERIEVRVVTPRLRRSRHLIGTNKLCYMPYNPNAWTPSTTNLDVLKRVRNWLRGYLTDWRLADHVDLPEYRAYLEDTAPLDVYLLDHLYQKDLGGYGHLGLQAREKEGSRVAIAETLTYRNRERECVRGALRHMDGILLGAGKPAELTAVWFDIAGETDPVFAADDLIRVVTASGHFETAADALVWLDSQRTQFAVDGELLVFLRFRSRASGAAQWSAYALKPGSPHRTLVGENPGRRQAEDLMAAYRSGHLRAVRLYPLRLRDLFRRLDGVYDAAALHEKHVTVIGCGALGAPATSLLARAGVGHFTLVDGDDLAPWNVMRHELDFWFVRGNKARGVAAQLVLINPYVEAQAIPKAVKSGAEIRDAIEKADVVLVAIGDEAMEHLISRVALDAGKTVLYARGMAGMSVGRVHRVIPGRDACPVCLCEHRSGRRGARSDHWIEVHEPHAHVVYDDNCGFPAIPGAAVDTEQIANLLAHQAIQFLLGEAERANQWVRVGRPVPGATDPRLQAAPMVYPLFFEPLDGCDECGIHQEKYHQSQRTKPHAEEPDQPLSGTATPPYDQVELTSAARDQIIEAAAACGQLEGGGVVAGYVDAARRTLVITHATDGGPNAEHRRHYFMRDRAHCQRRIDEICRATNGTRDYVGEWHKHVAWETTPSPTDRKTLVNVATQANYHVTQPVMLICGIPDYRWREEHAIQAYSYRQGDDEVRELRLLAR